MSIIAKIYLRPPHRYTLGAPPPSLLLSFLGLNPLIDGIKIRILYVLLCFSPLFTRDALQLVGNEACGGGGGAHVRAAITLIVWSVPPTLSLFCWGKLLAYDTKLALPVCSCQDALVPQNLSQSRLSLRPILPLFTLAFDVYIIL